MEFKQIQVKVTTLNKSYFNQLEKLDRNDLKDKDFKWVMPEIIGWVNTEGIWFVVNNNGKLARVSQVIIADIWLAQNEHIPAVKACRYSNFWQIFKPMFLDKLEQIFI